MTQSTPRQVPLAGDDFVVYGPIVKLSERKEFKGSKGQVRSFMVFDGDLQKPLEVGMEFNREALKGLPRSLHHGYHSGEFEIELPYPVNSTVFNLLTWTWVAGPNGTQSNGHGPSGVYDIDHLDFHFYLNTQDVRDTINVFDSPDDYAIAQVAPPDEFWPKDYRRPVDAFMNGIGIAPGDGSHWNNSTYPEFKQGSPSRTYQFFESSGIPFGPNQRTVQYGAYDGHMTLIEPMVTVDYLKSKRTSSDSIQQPQKYFKSGFFPTSYDISYVEDDRFPHKVSLTDYVYHEASQPPTRNNAAPTSISLDNVVIYDNAGYLNLVGVLDTKDSHGPYRLEDDHVYALPFGIEPNLVDDAGNRFFVNGNQILVDDNADLQPGQTYKITVRSVDSGGLSITEDIDITVQPLGSLVDKPLSSQQRVLLQGSEAWNNYRRSQPNVRIDLSGSDLPGIVSSDFGPTSFDLSNARLDRADLSNSVLESVNMSRSSLRKADLADSYMFGINLQGADLRKANLQGADLSMANLSGADLRGANLRGAFLTAGADLTNANLKGAKIDNANLFTANLTGANLAGASLKNASLRLATVDNSVLDNVDLSSVNAFGVDFDTALSKKDTTLPVFANPSEVQAALFAGVERWNKIREENVYGERVDLTGMDFPPIGFDLTGYNLSNVILDGSYMEFTNLSGVDLRGSSLKGARMFGADLTGADFTGADLTGAFMPGSTNRSTNYRSAKLDSSVFSGATIEDVDFRGSSLKRTEFRFVNQANARHIASGNFLPSDFRGSDLGGSRFRASIFRDSNFTGVDFSSLADVSSSDFAGMIA